MRPRVLQAFCALTKLPEITRLVQRGRDPDLARYTIEFADGTSVRVGTIKVLWSQAELARVLAVTVGCVPPAVEPPDWRRAIGLLIVHATDVEEGESFDELVVEWVRRYSRTALSDKDGAAPAGEPFNDDGALHIHANSLARFIRREYSEPVKIHALRQALDDVGFERVTIRYRPSVGSPSSTSYYRIPREHLESL